MRTIGALAYAIRLRVVPVRGQPREWAGRGWIGGFRRLAPRRDLADQRDALVQRTHPVDELLSDRDSAAPFVVQLAHAVDEATGLGIVSRGQHRIPSASVGLA